MKELLISSALRRIGKRPLKRLEWAVDFSQRKIETPEDQSKAELELTCFFWGTALADYPGLPITKQIKAMMTEKPWIEDSFRGHDVTRVQETFTNILMAAAGAKTEFDLPLKHIKVKFTRAEGVEYNLLSESSSEAKQEAVAFKLLRLLDKTIRTSVTRNGRDRFTPLRQYVATCPESVLPEPLCKKKLFAKTRIDQEYCSRTCVSRAQVRRFRRNQQAQKKKKEMKAQPTEMVRQRLKQAKGK